MEGHAGADGGDGTDHGAGDFGEQLRAATEVPATVPHERDVAGRFHAAGEFPEDKALGVGGAAGALGQHCDAEPHRGQGLCRGNLTAPVCDEGVVNTVMFSDDMENPAAGKWAFESALGSAKWDYYTGSS